jgi:uncharacterized pyridoxal phosphate-dependent enzyme
MSNSSITRRDLIRGGGVLGGLLALPAAVRAETQSTAPVAAAAATTGLRPTVADVYQSIGVRPLINARGTFTIISGSTMLPEVRAAMDAAAQKYVHLDELAEAVGARLATLTGAEWGMVSNGCSAGLTLATAACVAGGNPDLHIRLPNLAGFPKDEAVIPTHSRNVYDAALRSVGVRVVEVSTMAEFEAALGPRTAMIYILAGPNADNSPLSVKAIAPIAKEKGVPILVDAAAEILTIPNVHLQNGATLVAYSGGKCLRGPQTAGLLLGRKDLVKAAWVHSAPHHGVTRALKVGKEDAIGMLMAVEMWVKRDHESHAFAENLVGSREARDQRRGGREDLVRRGSANHAGCARRSAGAGRRVGHPLHDGGWRRAHHRRSIGGGVVEAACAAARGGTRNTRRRPDGPVDREDSVRRCNLDPYAAPDAEGERPRRAPSGRLHDAGGHGHNRRRHRQNSQRLRRAARRLDQPDVQWKAGG